MPAAMVTGGNSGIGRAVAVAPARDGIQALGRRCELRCHVTGSSYVTDGGLRLVAAGHR